MKKVLIKIRNRMLICLLCSNFIVFGCSSSYFNGEICLKAHATGLAAYVGVEMGGTYLAEIILAILTTVGLGGAYASNEDLQQAVNDYLSYASSSQAWIDEADEMYKMYCQVTGAEYDYTWSDFSNFDIKQEMIESLEKCKAKENANKELFEMYREGILTSEQYLWLENYVFTPSQTLVRNIVDWISDSVAGNYETTNINEYFNNAVALNPSQLGFKEVLVNPANGHFYGTVESVCTNSIGEMSTYVANLDSPYRIAGIVGLGGVRLKQNSANGVTSYYANIKKYDMNGNLEYSYDDWLFPYSNSLAADIPLFNNEYAMNLYLKYGTLAEIINMVVDRGMSQIIDNADIPFLGLDDVERIIDRWFDVGGPSGIGINDSNVWGNSDVGWGTYGGFAGTLWGLKDLAADIPDIYQKIIDGILEGAYDKPDVITYDDAWDKAISDAWDKAIDEPIVDTPDPAIAREKEDAIADAWEDTHDKPFSNPTEDDPETPQNPNNPGDIFGKDPGGLLALFNSLILVILIIIMLLIIFISCLAFIVMIFRIPASPGFMPNEMIQGFNYIKTLMIPGMNMSVYDFFMGLIYIILLFSVIGILRKNIDKIKIPRRRI